MKFAPGWREQCGTHVVPQSAMGQQRNEADLRSWKLAARTGRGMAERYGAEWVVRILESLPLTSSGV
jgi:hypothetical protein